MVIRGPLLAIVAGLSWVVSSSTIFNRDEVVTCTETTTGNAFVNPSWEDGTSGWEYNCTLLKRNHFISFVSHG